MDKTVQDSISISNFRTTTIISELVLTAIVLVGFYLIFNRFNSKNKEFRKRNRE